MPAKIKTTTPINGETETDFGVYYRDAHFKFNANKIFKKKTVWTGTSKDWRRGMI